MFITYKGFKMITTNRVSTIDKEIVGRTSRMRAICDDLDVVGCERDNLCREHDMLSVEVKQLLNLYKVTPESEPLPLIIVNTPVDMGKTIIESALASANFFGTQWPDNAEFGIAISYHTWPMGWSKTVVKRFFETEKELNADLLDLQQWALSKDNQVRVEVFQWDLGYESVGVHHFQ